LAKAASLIGLRQFAAAQQALSRVTQRLRNERDRWTAINLDIQRARLQISLGDLERAADCLALDPERPMRASNLAEYDAYRALIDAARGREESAAKHLKRSLSTSRNLEPRAIVWIGQAVLDVTCGPAHNTEVQRIFESTRRAGNHDAIVMGCRAQPELASRISRDEDHGKELSAILLRSNDELLARAAGLHVPRTTRRAETLSQRENDVYELMIQGRTNREIARRLFITESTTKVHVRHILEKLGVRSRVEAVGAWHPTVTSDSGFDDAG
jgi:DNA-binding CsgD family transcriptional regulator